MKYLITGKGKGTYNGGNPLSASNIFATHTKLIKPSNLEKEGAIDGNILAWSDIQNKWSPYNITNLPSKWTELSGNLYRNSQVTIGQDSIINADLGIKQNNLTNCLRIDQPSTGRRNAVSTYGLGGVERHRLDSWGIAQWLMYTGFEEAGALAFTTPVGFIGLMTASNFSYTNSTRGYIVWSPLNTDGNIASCKIGVRNVDCLLISASGRMAYGPSAGFGSGVSHSFKLISGNTLIAAFFDTSNNLRFRIHDTDGIQTDDLNLSLSRPWRLGQKIDASVSLDTTKYITVQVDGVDYNLALATV